MGRKQNKKITKTVSRNISKAVGLKTKQKNNQNSVKEYQQSSWVENKTKK